MTEVTATHRRAALRGREAVARGRINSAVRAGRVLSVVSGVVSVLPLALGVVRGWSVPGIGIAIAAGIFLATERMQRGSRVAACVLLAVTGFMAYSTWHVATLVTGALLTVLTVVFANGAWGTFALARVQRNAAHEPPAPARPTGERRPI